MSKENLRTLLSTQQVTELPNAVKITKNTTKKAIAFNSHRDNWHSYYVVDLTHDHFVWDSTTHEH